MVEKSGKGSHGLFHAATFGGRSLSVALTAAHDDVAKGRSHVSKPTAAKLISEREFLLLTAENVGLVKDQVSAGEGGLLS